jgi:hypothetical protein
MDDLSGYYAQHPLENPANYLGTKFDPEGAAAYRESLQRWREARRVLAERSSFVNQSEQAVLLLVD